jgi:hypothetical protein
MDIHLRQTLGTGYGVTRKDAALVQALVLKYLGRGQQLTLRFDTLKTVSQEFVVCALAQTLMFEINIGLSLRRM